MTSDTSKHDGHETNDISLDAGRHDFSFIKT